MLCAIPQEKFLLDRIKVNGKTGNLGDLITVSRDKAKVRKTSAAEAILHVVAITDSYLLSYRCSSMRTLLSRSATSNISPKNT